MVPDTSRSNAVTSHGTGAKLPCRYLFSIVTLMASSLRERMDSIAMHYR